VEDAKLLRQYEVMLRERYFVLEQCTQNSKGKIHGYLHCYTGEEAIAAGICADLTPQDSVFSTHRAEGHLVSMGARFDKMMAESFGRVDGYGKGLGGVMHMSVPEIGLVHSNGVVGGGIGLAVGAALAHRYRKDGRVAVAFFGDGASSHGVLYEGMNLASIWKLPVIFVLENNGFAISSPASKMISIADVARRADGYSLPGITVDGNDLAAVYEAASAAIKRARAGEGPTFLECKTYRTRGHNEGDPQWYYRTREDVKDWEQNRDPVKRVKSLLLSKGLLTEEKDKAMIDEIKRELAQAVAFADASPYPGEEYLEKYVWKEQ